MMAAPAIEWLHVTRPIGIQTDMQQHEINGVIDVGCRWWVGIESAGELCYEDAQQK
jgi:hypothetical protein